MVDVIKDLTKLSTTEDKEQTYEKMLRKSIFSKVDLIVAQGVEESLMSNRDISEFDFGFGKLLIKVVDNEEIKWKFVPSAKLEDEIKETIMNKKSSLESVLEKGLVEKFININKEII